MKKSWKTTGSGLAVILAAAANVLNLLTDGDPATMPDWNIVLPQLAAGIGLIFSRDFNKSSEDEGIKKIQVVVNGGTETK